MHFNSVFCAAIHNCFQKLKLVDWLEELNKVRDLMPSVRCDFGNPRSLNCVSLTKSVPFEPNQIKLKFDHFSESC